MSKTCHIVIAAPGKGIGKGGIVRQMQYLMEESMHHDDAITLHWLATHNNRRIWYFTFIGSLIRLLWLILRYRPQGLLLNMASKGSFWRKASLQIIARLARLPVTIYLHGGGFEAFYATNPLWIQQQITSSFCHARNIIVLGTKSANFAQSLGVKRDNIHIMRNAVPHPLMQRVSHLPLTQFLYVGHLLPRKGLEELLKAMTQLPYDQWQLTIAGSGNDTHYQQLAASLGLTEHVNFTGWIEHAELQAHYSQADCLILPSYIENQPLCVLEAMSHKLAIITTSVGTLPEICTDQQDALLIAPGDADAIANACLTIIEDKSLRTHLGNAAHQTYCAHHTMPYYYDSLMHIMTQHIAR